MLAAELPPYGDWLGTVESAGGQPVPTAAQVIPLGGSFVQINLLDSFAKPWPPRQRLYGTATGAKFRLLDVPTVTPDDVVAVTDGGLVIKASLWEGAVGGDRLAGQFAGASKGKFALEKTARPSPHLGAPPPPGAAVLFDGTNLDAWRAIRGTARAKAEWRLADGALEIVPGKGSLISGREFGDHRLHLEFRSPLMPEARGQGRGNSGVYLLGRYEIQILDSYGLEGADNECGGIYKVGKPRVNMCAPPGQWQSYDITFRAPRFDAAGKKTANARITVDHNGTLIHDDAEIPDPTGGAAGLGEVPRAGLMLQDHGNRVQFRNIWVVE